MRGLRSTSTVTTGTDTEADVLTIRAVDEGRVRTVDAEELASAAREADYLWVDLAAPDADEQQLLTDPTLGLDPLTVADMREERHLPKVDVHGDELAVTVHAVAVRAATEELTTLELDVAVREHLLVTYHEQPVTAVTHVGRRLDDRGAGSLARPVQLLHLLLDTMMDVFLPFTEHLDERLDVVEEDILTDPTELTRREIYELQRDVIQLRRAIVPQAEVVRRLGREPVELVTADDRELFRDVYDHLFRITELSDSYLQLLDSAMASYRSALDDELNDMLNLLTLISAVLLPVTTVAGIYGMNFTNMPELSLTWAYPAVWGLFVLIVTGMLLWFRRRGWIGRAAEREAKRRRAGLSEVLDVPLLGTVVRVPLRGARAVARAGRRRNRPGPPGAGDDAPAGSLGGGAAPSESRTSGADE